MADDHLPHDDEFQDKVRAILHSTPVHQGEGRRGLAPRKSIGDFMTRRSSDAHLKNYGIVLLTFHTAKH